MKPRAESLRDAVGNVAAEQTFLADGAGAGLSYGGLCALSLQVETVLLAAGLSRGAIVAVIVPEGPTAVAAIVASLLVSVAAPVNPSLAEPEMLALLRRIRPAAVMVHASLLQGLSPLLDELGLPVIAVNGFPELTLERAGSATRGETHGKAGDDVCEAGVLLPTSGTTGEPRLVFLDQARLLHAATGIVSVLELTGDDRNLCVLPCFHIHGLSTVLATLLSGGTVIAVGRFSTQWCVPVLLAQKATWFSATPAHFKALLHSLDGESLPPEASALRFVRSASAPLPESLREATEAAFSVPVIQSYGMTEAGPLIASNGLSDDERRAGSVGRPVGIELDIVPLDGLPRSGDDPGEIVVRGPGVIRQYYAGEQRDARLFESGWLRTGDLGVMDADGFLYVTGRSDDLINSGGEKIDPQQVESVLLAHPAVQEAAVFPAPHAVLGQVAHAAVVLREGFLPAQDEQPGEVAALERILRRFCLSRVSRSRVPQSFRFLPAIPVGNNNKLQRKKLYELLQQRAPQDVAVAAGATPSALLAVVVAAWRDVLGPGDYAPDDNFFLCGGDSLTATMVVNRFATQFSIDLPVDSLFLYPTAVEQAERLSQLVPGERRAEPLPARVAPASCLEQVLPLSSGQRRLWFLYRAGAGSEYNMSQPIWLHGSLDTAAIEAALNVLRQRHSALRTTINVLDGHPVQRIRPFRVESLTAVDLSGVEPGQARERALALAGDYRNEVFDLAAGPLFRARLLRLDEQCHLLVLTIHHIVCDGWSMALLQSELDSAYRAIAAGKPGDTGGDVPQYADYVAGNLANERGAQDSKRELLRWWRRQLHDVDPILRLPYMPGAVDGMYGGVKAGARLHFELSRKQVGSLESVAARLGTTLYAVFAASLGILLQRFTGQQRFCLGTVNANRSDPGMEKAVGFFARTLPLPLSVADTEALEAVLELAAVAIRQVSAHADVEFDEILQASGVARRADVAPLFQVMLAFQNLPRSLRRGAAVEDVYVPAGVEMETTVVDGDSAKYDLSLYVRPGESALKGIWQYRRDKIDASVIEAMHADFLAILDALVQSPRSTVAELPLRAQQGFLAGRTSLAAHAAGCPPLLAQAFARHAAMAPHRVALGCQSGQLTYAELAVRVNTLGNYLRAHTGMCGAEEAAGRGRVVAVLLPRDEHLVVAAMAVMSSGAAFMPLEPGYPMHRLRQMMEVAGVDLLIVNRETRAVLPELGSDGLDLPPVLCLDDNAAGIAASSPAPPIHLPVPDDAAYIIFTSGSTGTPKGVVLSQRNLAHYIEAMSRELGIVESDTYLYTASCAFSASVRQFALPLSNGAKVVIATRETMTNMAALLDTVSNEGVTVLDLVPTVWQALHKLLSLSGQRYPANAFARLRLLLSASEPLPALLARMLRDCWPHAELINMYGQTETTGIVAMNRAAGEAGDAGVAPLGRPLPGATVVLLDEQGAPVADGAIGEICIGGPCIGQGYLSASGLTSLATVRLEQHGQGTAVFYRTGDMGRLDESGVLAFCGRMDTQIKHRGFRIEPGAIEVVALAYPGVTEAAVFLGRRSALPGTEELQLAYSAAVRDGRAIDAAQLRGHLRDNLPGHMVPARLFELQSMPRTPAGKLDRAALALQLHGEPPADAGSEPAALQSDSRELAAVTQALGSIWEDVLGCEDVGPHDNFFDLGGNSILSIEVVSDAIDAGLDLNLEQLFQYQTIAELAPVVAAGQAAARQHPEASREIPCQPPTRNDIEPPRYSLASLRAFSLEALQCAGLSAEGADILTEVQLESSLRGQVTHNIGDIPRYAQRLAAGALNADPAITVSDTSAISATVDGDNAPGQWVATVAMERAIALASDSGAGLVSVKRSNHFGAAGHYAWRASQAGMIGLCFTNGPVVLAPTGGVTPLFGNNPIAIGLPCGSGEPVVLDISMSVATRGKIGLAVAEGEPLQPGWILDELGIPSTRLADLAAGLAAPIGGHKGYGLAFAIEALAGALSGSGYCRDHSREVSAGHGGSDIGHLFIAFKPDLFMPREQFEARLADIVQQAKSSELARGSSEIFVPGEIELRARRENMRRGVPLPASVVRRLTDYGRRHKLRATIERVYTS